MTPRQRTPTGAVCFGFDLRRDDAREEHRAAVNRSLLQSLGRRACRFNSAAVCERWPILRRHSNVRCCEVY
jgi:hypothetical protein